MSLFGKKQQPSGGKPEKMPPPKDTSIFGGKSVIPMRDAAWRLRNASPHIPGSGGATFSRDERTRIANELTKKYGGGGYLKKGPTTSSSTTSRIYRDLRRQKARATTGAEKLAVDRKIRWLQEHLGK